LPDLALNNDPSDSYLWSSWYYSHEAQHLA
jgi:hypothetical protein